MRVLIAMMKHETNSFSPVVTNLKRFEEWGLYREEQVLAAYAGTRMPIAAYLELAEERGCEIITPLAAEAMPSGLVEESTYDTLVEWILQPLKEMQVDAVFLDLHGAMTARHIDDGEGELLKRIRALAPDIPIAVTLDLHTNMSAAMATHCSMLIGYKTYPHVDMYEVGQQVGKSLWRQIGGSCQPVTAWGSVPVLAQTLRMGTDDEPMRSLQRAALDAEKDPSIVAATVFGGFPMVDVEHAGVSVVVVADNDRGAARRVRDRLLQMVWQEREELVYSHRPLNATLNQARQVNDQPVLLLDHADNVGSGGTSDVMAIIKAVLDAGLDDVAVAAVFDPEAVTQMTEAGIGAKIQIELGGKIDMPEIELRRNPLPLTGEVVHLSDGCWIVRGPMYTGVEVHTGPTAVFQTRGLRIVVTSIHHEPWDTGILVENGIDPASCRYVLLKSRIHYRAGFASLAKATFTLDGEGVTTSNNEVLNYKKLRRPIYPLDQMDQWIPPEALN